LENTCRAEKYVQFPHMKQHNNLVREEITQQDIDQLTAQDLGVWTIHEIARFYRRSTRWAERLTKTASFPVPLRGDSHRWWANDVVEYAQGSKTQSADEVLRPIPKQQSVMRIGPARKTHRPATKSPAPRTKVGAK
jgi:hypothetical protein